MVVSTVPVVEYAERLKSLKALIGNTPLLGVHFIFSSSRRVIYAKAEHEQFRFFSRSNQIINYEMRSAGQSASFSLSLIK